MASKNKIIEMIASVKTIYPYYAKETDVQMLVKTWGLLLRDVPDDITEVAFFKCLQTCKMPPTPADVLEQAKAIISVDEPSDEELWASLLKALRQADRLVYRFDYTFVESNGRTQGQNARADFEKLWDSLPDKLRMYLGGKGELIRMSHYGDDELKFEKNRFLKTMPTIAQRKEYNELSLMLTGGNLMLNE